MNIQSIIESVGLSAEELREYVIEEIDEFIAADTETEQENEFSDIMFALKTMAFARTNKHLSYSETGVVEKLFNRFKQYSTISKTEPRFYSDAIKQIPVKLVHVAFGNFQLPRTNFDPCKNGTETEIALLTDNCVDRHGVLANHLIITFDTVDGLEYSFLESSCNIEGGNTILCRIPDFLFQYSKNKKSFSKTEAFLCAQTLGALKHINCVDDVIFHCHSWESGVVCGNEDFSNQVAASRMIFSPYLTVSRLQQFIFDHPNEICTLSANEIEEAVYYEARIVKKANQVIVESDCDYDHYKTEYEVNSINKISYSSTTQKEIYAKSIKNNKLYFVAGGRPVYEKGFKELIVSFSVLKKKLETQNIYVFLDIFCKEYDWNTKVLKRKKFIDELEVLIIEYKLSNHVTLKDKVSILKLCEALGESDGLIVSSLYDPYCLMPEYAMDANTVSFVSFKAGISECIRSREFIFNPQEPGSLVKSVQNYLDKKPSFRFCNENTNYQNLYVA